MKQINFKIYIAFFSLFFLVMFVSLIALVTAITAYKENETLRSESLETTETIFRLEFLTSQLNLLGQKHLYVKNQEELDNYNKIILSTSNELDQLLQELLLKNKDGDKIHFYQGFILQWENFLSIYHTAIELSHNNQNEEAKEWLIKANTAFDELTTVYLKSLQDEHFHLINDLASEQKDNLKGYLSLAALLIVGFIAGFIIALYYLRKVLNESSFLKQKLEFLAFHDELTKLPNRRLFKKEVSAAIKKEEKFFLFYLDIDKFKTINDTFGHDMGDLVIKEFSNRVKSCIRQTDVMARQGGDEFTILLKEQSVSKAGEIADKMIESLQQPLMIDGAAIRTSTSIGITAYPSNGMDYLSLIKQADHALYEAKKKRNTFVMSSH